MCTLGARGAVARSRGSGRCVRAAAPPVAAIADTVGAGDHFCGAFLAAHLLKASLKQCLEVRAPLAWQRKACAQLLP